LAAIAAQIVQSIQEFARLEAGKPLSRPLLLPFMTRCQQRTEP